MNKGFTFLKEEDSVHLSTFTFIVEVGCDMVDWKDVFVS
jgi:hypothetical protein